MFGTTHRIVRKLATLIVVVGVTGASVLVPQGAASARDTSRTCSLRTGREACCTPTIDAPRAVGRTALVTYVRVTAHITCFGSAFLGRGGEVTLTVYDGDGSMWEPPKTRRITRDGATYFRISATMACAADGHIDTFIGEADFDFEWLTFIRHRRFDGSLSSRALTINC